MNHHRTDSARPGRGKEPELADRDQSVFLSIRLGPIVRGISDESRAANLFVALLAAALIIARGLLHFKGQTVLLAVLDLGALALFATLSMLARKWVYLGVIVLLPASSLTYLPAGLVPHDLSSVILLLSLVTLVKPLAGRNYDRSLYAAIALYGALCIYLLGFLSFEPFSDLTEMKAQFKAVYFLATAAATGFLFAKIYSPADSRSLQYALRVGIYAYLVTAALGYLFPLVSFTWEASSGFYFKSLFRYPGMSSSNYVANVLLLMLAAHWQLGLRVRQGTNVFWYFAIILICAVLSQSRGFVVGALVMLIMWWTQSIVNEGGERKVVRASPLKAVASGGFMILFAIVIMTKFSGFFSDLASQLFDRFGTVAMTNIDSRFDEWQQTARYFEVTGKSLLTGYHMFPDTIRPHNLVLSAILLFGVPVAIIISVASLLLAMRFFPLLFVFVAAQTEILFGTGLYDALFLIFLCTLASRTEPLKAAIRNGIFGRQREGAGLAFRS